MEEYVNQIHKNALVIDAHCDTLKFLSLPSHGYVISGS